MGMAVKMYSPPPKTIPLQNRIMEKNNFSPVVADFMIIINSFPRQFQRSRRIMVPRDESLPTILPKEEGLRGLSIGSVENIAKMPDEIVGSDACIRELVPRLIVFFNRTERTTITQYQDAFMAEMCIGCEKYCHSTYTTGVKSRDSSSMILAITIQSPPPKPAPIFGIATLAMPCSTQYALTFFMADLTAS